LCSIRSAPRTFFPHYLVGTKTLRFNETRHVPPPIVGTRCDCHWAASFPWKWRFLLSLPPPLPAFYVYLRSSIPCYRSLVGLAVRFFGLLLVQCTVLLRSTLLYSVLFFFPLSCPFSGRQVPFLLILPWPTAARGQTRFPALCPQFQECLPRTHWHALS